VLTIGAVFLLVGGIVLAARTEVAAVGPSDPIGEPAPSASVVFVCRNGVAMSAWSAAYFNRPAAARGLPERALARAWIPSYTAVPLRMVLALVIDGFRLGDFRPHVMDSEDARGARSRRRDRYRVAARSPCNRFASGALGRLPSDAGTVPAS
jgi:hypothetical protein